MEYLTGPLLAFLGISVLVIATPGPDTAVTIRNTLLGGRAGGIALARRHRGVVARDIADALGGATLVAPQTSLPIRIL